MLIQTRFISIELLSYHQCNAVYMLITLLTLSSNRGSRAKRKQKSS